MSKKSRKEIYIHMCNYSKSLKTTLQITDENIKDRLKILCTTMGFLMVL